MPSSTRPEAPAHRPRGDNRRVQQTREDGFEVDDDGRRLQLDVVHDFLRQAYWSTGVPQDVVTRALRNSLVVGLYAPDGRQAGMARAVTDRATFAWIADVFVLPQYRGRGLGRFVVEALLEHPDLKGLRRMMLATADAHDLYRRYGFEEVAEPEIYLARLVPPAELYGANDEGAPTGASNTTMPILPTEHRQSHSALPAGIRRGRF